MNTLEYATATIDDSVKRIREVGLHEAWFSIEPNLAPGLVQWAIDRGCTVEEADWNPPSSIYAGPGTPTGPLVVLALKW